MREGQEMTSQEPLWGVGPIAERLSNERHEALMLDLFEAEKPFIRMRMRLADTFLPKMILKPDGSLARIYPDEYKELLAKIDDMSNCVREAIIRPRNEVSCQP